MLTDCPKNQDESYVLGCLLKMNLLLTFFLSFCLSFFLSSSAYCRLSEEWGLQETHPPEPQAEFRVATVMEKSWNSWNFEIFWNFWKSHGILTNIVKGHGKVMEF